MKQNSFKLMEFRKHSNIIFFVYDFLCYLSWLYCLVSVFGLIYAAVMLAVLLFAHHSAADCPE